MDDLTHLRPGESTYKDKADAGLLESFPNPRPDRLYEVRFVTEEVTSLCPITGQPDFYTVDITYVPHKRCIESKSLKLYLFSFRNTGLFAEDMTNRLLDDLAGACAPRWMRVVCNMRPRGGIALSVKAEHGKPPKERQDTDEGQQ